MKERLNELVRQIPQILKGLIALVILLIILVLLDILAQAFEAKADPQPVQAKVIYVIDGDTADIRLLPSKETVRLRLRDIDAPEMNGRCPAENHLARQARQALTKILPAGTLIFLSQTGQDKYGRLLARVRLNDGRDPGGILIAQGLAVPFGFGRPDWCKGS